MKILFIGGTGNISLACTREALGRGHEVYHLNRGNNPGVSGVTSLKADVRDLSAAQRALEHMTFDVVADFIAFTPDHIRSDLELFREKTRQFIFISSASVYHKPVRHHVITESTPAFNPFWTYSQNKIACEHLLFQAYREEGFPVTIVRPSHTYSDGYIPLPLGSDFTIPRRILDGRPVPVHGDGSSLWTLTHSQDFARGFAGLLGNPRALGETYHITSDEALSWETITLLVGEVLGREPRMVHIPSDSIARLEPELGAGLLGDKTYSVVFDNSKIKNAVPGYQAVIPFHEGLRRSVAWFMADEKRQTINPHLEKALEHILGHWNK